MTLHRMPLDERLAGLFATLWAAGALVACDSPATCGLGMRYDGKMCVPAAVAPTCGAGTVADQATGMCVLDKDAVGADTQLNDAGDSGIDGGDVVSPVDGSGADGKEDGPTLATCIPQCAASEKACGDDGCGKSCGTCGAGEKCTVYKVCFPDSVCVPDCSPSQVCGDDGCGSVCGVCLDPSAPVCIKGACDKPCVPDCVLKSCGEDGCGGSCGSCEAGSTCSPAGNCVPNGWTCADTAYGSGGQCDCSCGAPDPDCEQSSLLVAGCGEFQKCENGVCVSTIPASWTCSPQTYANGKLCDCGCGAPDPDCEKPAAKMVGCEWNEKCDPAGVCKKCVPSCTDKICGDDGCGGNCGDCPSGGPSQQPLACVAGKCVDGCLPKPLVCETAKCGDDGCGGSCGSCPANTYCSAGQCAVAPGKSCAGHCKASAPGGCSCAPGCELTDTCCPDFAAECQCEANCKGKACGPDGCGGSCGVCAPNSPAPYCDATGQCGSTCVPACAGKGCGSDGCGGTCGTCAAGATCNDAGLCVGAGWSCDPNLYAEGTSCDCSCGLPDPDCTAIQDGYGCPSGVTCDVTKGICKMTFCGANKDCKTPKWCIGHYPTGDGHLHGYCQVPNPATYGAGMSCLYDTDCATGVCASGTCRTHCTTLVDCEKGALCIGVPFVDGLTLAPTGVATVCDSSALIGETCTSQAACGPNKQCLALIKASDLGSEYRCGILTDPSLEGSPCQDTSSCGIGLLCSAGKCMRACPGGNPDCPTGATCGVAVLHGGLTSASSDDIAVKACVKQ